MGVLRRADWWANADSHKFADSLPLACILQLPDESRLLAKLMTTSCAGALSRLRVSGLHGFGFAKCKSLLSERAFQHGLCLSDLL